MEKMIDQESEHRLDQMAQQEKVLTSRIEGVRTVLVVLSSKAMVFDLGALRQKIALAYPDATIFFQTTSGKAIGATVPESFDLLIDFTGPGQRQNLFFAKKVRRQARFTVGRNAGLFRKKIYDRIYDEKGSDSELPSELLQRERYVQKKILNLAGIAFPKAGEALPDRGKTIALELPSMQGM